MFKSIIRSIQVISFTFSNELKRIYSDRGALLILLGAAVIYPIAYSIAYKNNVLEEIPIGIVDLDNSNASYQMEKMINSSEKVKKYNVIAKCNKRTIAFCHNQIGLVFLFFLSLRLWFWQIF